MLQRIRIENFIRVPYLDLEVTRPVLFIGGGNEAGKTTIKEAIQFAFYGDNPRVKYKKDYDQLVTNGAKRGSVEVTFDNYTVKRNVKDGKATGDTDAIPTDQAVAAICLGSTRFVELEEKARRGLVMRLLNVEVTPAKITAELKARGIGEATIKRYEPIYKNGLAAAFDKADRIVKEDRGAWKEVTGEVYGPEKAEGWAPADPVISIDEVRASQAALDEELVGLQAAREKELEPVLAKLKELTDAIEQPNPLACPECSAALLYQGGHLIKYEGLSEQQKTTHKALRSLQQKKAEEIRAKHDALLRAKIADRQALDQQVLEASQREKKKARAAELHAGIKDAEVLKALFGDGPDGIMGRAVTQATTIFNDRVATLAKSVGWLPVTLSGDMSVRRTDGVIYPLLSESAQWRADFLLHVVIAQLAAFHWLVFDRVDVLEPPDRPRFIKWANAFGDSTAHVAWPLTILAFATLKEKPDLSSLEAIQCEWLAAGEIDRGAP